jgi:hypothetical protein
MPSLSYGIGAFDRDAGSLPELKCINLFAEGARTSEGQICLQSRPGLSVSQTDGAGPIRGIYREEGVFGGNIFTISTNNLYRANALVHSGAVSTGTDGVSFAGTATELLFVRQGGGGRLKRYDGAAATTPVFPDSANCRDVVVINFLFVAVRSDGTYPGRFYWSAVNNGNSWDALDYATAERVPDEILALLAINDNLWMFGQSSIEIMQATGNADAPFKRIPQVAFDVGIIGVGCAVKADNSAWWIGADAVVYRAEDGRPLRISDHWLEAKIKASSTRRMSTFKREGHQFVCVRLDNQTFAYDAATQQWCEFQTNGGNWRPRCAAMVGAEAYFGDATDGKVMTFSGWTDPGSVAIDRKFTAATMLTGPTTVNNVRLWLNVGQAPTGVTPTLYMKQSRDAGQTYSAERSVDIGNAADDGTKDYRARAEFRRCGMFDEPGLMMEFRYSAAGDFRVSAVKANEGGGGRSRA